MVTTYRFNLVPISDITVKDRQRKELGNLEGLADSILRFGLLHPIVVTRFGVLIAGERRLRAIQSLGKSFPSWPNIPVHFYEELDSFQLRAIELEENLRREGLTWQEECLAYLAYHEARKGSEPEWTVDATSDALGQSERSISRRIMVARELLSASPAILKCDTMSAAFNILDRSRQRIIDTELADMARTGTLPKLDLGLDRPKEDKGHDKILDGTAPLTSRAIRPAEEDILLKDFRQWVSSYDGETFNLIHCDFPYGISFHESDQAGIKNKESETYDDSPEVYWNLIDTLLNNQRRFISESAHMLFWFSMNNYEATRSAFEAGGWAVNPMPLIWFKSDNTGIIPDTRRGPRQVYETCFLMSRGDRKIVRAVKNVADVPAKRQDSTHPSEKAFLALNQFLSMLVDGTTRFLDPTCGSGNSVAAAEYQGASRVLGLEINPIHVESAQSLLTRQRVSRASKFVQ